MALIYRAIVEVDADDVIVLSRRLAQEWARNKLERPELELSLGERFADEKRGVELHSIDVSTGESAVFRFVYSRIALETRTCSYDLLNARRRVL